MKKLLILVISLTTFSLAASAQQNGFFDMQKYFQKKNKESKQLKKLTFIIPSLKNQSIISSAPRLNSRRFSHTLSNSDKVYTMAYDNMPCVVPDMKKFKQMPNLFYGENYLIETSLNPNNAETIPNAANPFL